MNLIFWRNKSGSVRFPHLLSRSKRRGREFERLFKSMGLQNVRIDQAGNVIGVRPGKTAHPNLVLAAHLDTVFPEGTDVKVRREGKILKAPGLATIHAA